MATEEQVRQAMKELGIKEYKNTEKTSPAYKRAEKILDEADLDKSRIENNKKGMEARLKQYAQNKQSSTVPQQITDKVVSGKQQDLDNLYPKKQVEAPQTETPKQTKTFTDKLKNVNNKINSSRAGKFAGGANRAAGGLGKFLGVGSAIQGGAGMLSPYADNLSRAYDATGVLGGVTSLFTGGLGSLATGGGAAYNTSKAQEIKAMNKSLMDNEYADLVKSGIDPEVAFTSVYGNIDPRRVGVNFVNDRAFQRQYLASTVPEATASATQREASSAKPVNKKVDMKQKMQNEVATDTQNLPQASGNVEQFIEGQIAKYGGYNGGANVPPADVASENEQPAVPPQEVVPTQAVDQQGVQEQAQMDYAQQIMNMTPQGYVSSQDIMDKLNTAYANINQQINADPRYQGGAVQANNPYNIDERELAKLQRADQYMNAFGVQSDLAGQYAQQRQVMYEQQMANQLGVPYNDYINATLEQRKARIANEAQQMENVLTLQAQQATDMKTRLEAMNKMQELRNEVATEMYKAELDAQTKKDVAMLNAVGGIAKTQAFTNAPSTMLQAAGQYAGNVGGVLGGNYMYSNLWAMTPAQRGMFMNAGRPISDEELQAFFGRMGNVPAQFRTQGGQMPTQPQSQGILPNIAQWIMGE